MKRSRFHYYSKNKRLQKSFSVVLLISLLIILFSFYMQVSVFEAKKKHNEDIYGSWNIAVYDISKESKTFLENNQMISSSGTMDILGTVISNDVYGKLGSVDDDFVDMSHIKIKTGRLPINDNEIAVESFKLDQMGLDYSLNQNIRLEIENGSEIISKDYILCGVLDNYSTTWNNNSELISFFVKQDVELPIISQNIFISAIDGYNNIFNDISLPNNEIAYVNNNVEFTYDAFSRQNLPYTILAVFTVLYSILLLSYLLYNWTNQHSKELQMLKSMGLDNWMLTRDFSGLLGKSLLLPFIISIFICIILKIYWKVIVIGLGIYLLSLFMILLICFIQLKSIPDNINSLSSEKKVIQKPIKVKYRRQNPLSLCIRSFQFNWKKEILLLLIPVLLLVFVYKSLNLEIINISQQKVLDRQVDISLNSKMSMTNTDEIPYVSNGINSNLVDEIIANKSLDHYSTNYLTFDYYITWSGMEGSDIWRRENSEIDTILNKDSQNNKKVFD